MFAEQRDYRALNGIRVDAACERALEIGARSYSSVASILKNNLDRQRTARAAAGSASDHRNIRGPQILPY